MVLKKFFKELKKRLRRKRRRWLILAFWIVFVTASISMFLRSEDSRITNIEDLTTVFNGNVLYNLETPDGVSSDQVEMQDILIQKIKTNSGKHPVVMVTHYVCGEESKRMGVLDSQSILKIHEEFPQAHITMDDDGVVIFTRLVNDLSPQCKDNAYFGVDAAGNLTLYEGPPGENNVIRTFFQLNIRYLESRYDTVEQLVRGIRITDMAEYYSVLSTFSDYAVDDTEKVMKQQQTLEQ